MSDITQHPIHELQKLLSEGEVTSVELTTAYLEKIEDADPKIRAYLTVTPEEALKQAEEADKRIQAGNVAPLTGIPLGIKDNMCLKGVRTTCASKILENFVPPYTATVLDKLETQGAVFLGKLNLDEFAMGSSTENSAFFPTHNPYNLEHIPGGSSGGSAAATAACLCAGSLGSDTGGSIRQPASHCGVVGMKPTYGRVSRFGLVAFASSLDQIGPITRNVRDCAIMLQAISGYDHRDSTSVNLDVPDYLAALDTDLTGMTVGLPKEYFGKGLSEDVEGGIKNAIKVLEQQGARIVEVSVPNTKYAIACYYIIAPAEASSNLARYDGVKYGHRAKGYENLLEMYKKTRSEGFGAEVKRRIMIGTYCLSSGYYDAYYKKASQVRTLITMDFQKAFEKCDVMATPVAPTPAFKIGEKSDDPLQMYLSDIFTISTNLAGLPGLSVPCAVSSSGLPIGIQFMAPHFKEESTLKVGYALEQALGAFKEWPQY